MQGLDQLAPELAVSAADVFPAPGISLASGPSLDSEHPSEGNPEVRPFLGLMCPIFLSGHQVSVISLAANAVAAASGGWSTLGCALVRP